MSNNENQKCPNCNIALMPNKIELDLGYGAIVKRCANCNAIYIDNSIKEAAITGIDKGDRRIVRGYVFVTFAIGIILTALLVVSLAWASRIYYITFAGPILLIYSIYCFVKEIATYKKRKRLLDEELQRSKQRLQDNQYRTILINNGIAIPNEYLNNYI